MVRSSIDTSSEWAFRAASEIYSHLARTNLFAICETHTRNAGLSRTHDTPRNERSPSAGSASSHVSKRRPRVRSCLPSQVHQVRKTTRSKPSRPRSPCFTSGPVFADASSFVSLEVEVGRHHRRPPVLSIGERAPRATNGNSGMFRDEPDLGRNTRSVWNGRRRQADDVSYGARKRVAR